MKTEIPRSRLIIAAIAVPIILFGIWQIRDLSRPKILAEVEIQPTSLIITNLNAEAWQQPTIWLNSPLSGHRLKISDAWPAGETHTIGFSKFTTLQGQPFEPTLQSVERVIIDAKPYSMSAYD